MISKILSRWADSLLSAENKALKRELAALRDDLSIERSRNKINQVEIDLLSAVAARDVKRVESETAAYASKIVREET